MWDDQTHVNKKNTVAIGVLAHPWEGKGNVVPYRGDQTSMRRNIIVYRGAYTSNGRRNIIRWGSSEIRGEEGCHRVSGF